MSYTLHLPPAEIEARLAHNVNMYENSRWPNDTTRNLAEHWRECRDKFVEYQAGRITLADLPSDVRTMGWKMPAWGTYGT